HRVQLSHASVHQYACIGMVDDVHVDRHPLAFNEQVGDKDRGNGDRAGTAHRFVSVIRWAEPRNFGTLGEATLRPAFCVRNEMTIKTNAIRGGKNPSSPALRCAEMARSK